MTGWRLGRHHTGNWVIRRRHGAATEGTAGRVRRAVAGLGISQYYGATAERVLMRVSKTPPARRTRSATAAAAAKAPDASRGRRRTSRATASKAAGRDISAPSLGERILALATGRTRQELYLACPNDRPNHIGISVQRHLRAGRIQERDGKLYATSPAAHATA